MDILYILYVVLFGISGLIVGGFCNVLIYRLPRDIPIMRMPRCAGCDAKIKIYDCVPIISYLLLLGKCSECESRISPMYPLTELLVCFLWIFPMLLGQPIPQALISALFVTVLLVIALIDFSHLIIPHRLVIAIVVLSIPGFILQYPPVWYERLIGMAAGSGLFLLLSIIAEKILKKEAMGGGDIKFLAAVGLVMGWQLTLLSIGMGAFVALIMYIIMRYALRVLNEENQLPFAPALVAGMAISYYYGHALIHWYLHGFMGIPEAGCC
jgi:prepilin signal peptidase PulO-like enzyme (type II secretory pathway)